MSTKKHSECEIPENETDVAVEETVSQPNGSEPIGTEDAVPQTETSQNTSEDTATGTKSDALAQLQEKYNALNDQHLRMAAEYDNFRKRSAKERELLHADAVSYAVKALLPTFDNLERALAQATEDVEYKKGVELTQKQLTDALNSLNVTLIEDAPGTAFDPNLHNAVMHIDDESLGENVIAEVFQHGFMLGDKVIRHSMVKVAN